MDKAKPVRKGMSDFKRARHTEDHDEDKTDYLFPPKSLFDTSKSEKNEDLSGDECEVTKLRARSENLV